MSETEQLKAALTQVRPVPRLDPADLLSSGSTLLNKACSGYIRGAFPKGTFIHYVGDSKSGKTLVCYNTLAEAAANPVFDGYRLIYSNPERRDFWDLSAFWGQRLTDRIEPPRGTRDAPDYYNTVQDMYFALYRAFVWKKDGKTVDVAKTTPFIWVEDSLTSLRDLSAWEKFQTNVKKDEDGKDLEGSYGMGKPKANSEHLQWLATALAETGSIAIFVNQTRDTVGFGSQFNPNTFAGGRSLTFYATHELWSRTTGEISRTVRGKPRNVGTTVEIRVQKNSVNGKKCRVEVPLYSDFGLDDLGSCVDYLVEEKHWSAPKGVITSPEFEYEGNREGLIRVIEEQELEGELRKLVNRVWDEVAAACVVERKPRYR